jgi:hypothetical protein
MKRRFVMLLWAVLTTAPAWAVSEAKVCAPEPTDMAIVYGDVLSGENCQISPAIDVDVFRFVASAGDKIRIAATDHSGSSVAEVCVALIGPDGLPVPGVPLTCGEGAVRRDTQIPGTGEYKIHVSDSGSDAGFPYSLTLERVNPANTGWPVMDYGQIREGEINPAPDLDMYRFAGRVGDIATIIATDLSGSSTAEVCLELLGPDGEPVVPASCGEFSAQIANVVLNANGTYAIVISDSGLDTTFPYNLTMVCQAGACPKLPVCDLALGYASGTLNIDATLRTVTPANWNLFFVIQNFSIPVISTPTGVIDPARQFSIPVPGFPQLGTVGFLSTLTTGAGILCSDWETVNTGPASPAARELTPEQLRALIQRARLLSKQP